VTSKKRHNKEKHLLTLRVRSNQNRPDFADAEELFLLFKYPWELRLPRAMTEAIFCSFNEH
jgi:hypothetical protein